MSQKQRQRTLIRISLLLGTLAWGSFAHAAVPAKKKKSAHSAAALKRTSAVAKSTPKAAATHRAVAGAASVKSAASVKAVAAKSSTASSTTAVNRAIVARMTAGKKLPYRGAWRTPNYADSIEGDSVDGEDLIVRRAAVDALGPLNGAVVVTDANTGRILTIVNQKLAFQGGYQPCSTVKVPVALAALSESIVERTTPIRVYGRTTFTLTDALAKSNNQYFASLGQKLGFSRVTYYAKLFGLGEKAGLDIEDEQPGALPPSEPKSGIGMMTSFGDGILLTPLEYAALIGAVANGGTLYYLQYPKTDQDAEVLTPRVKRRLDIDQFIPEIKPGMMGAVEYGTARRAGFDPNAPVYGKTGTCTDSRSPTHLGWFGSFIDSGKNKYVVVVLLTGGRLVSGPAASQVAGNVYKTLGAQNYFDKPVEVSPIAMVTAGTFSTK